jgi:DUF2075 family protein
MTAFRASAAGLLQIAADGTLTDRIVEQRRQGAAPPERRSWAQSLPALARDLVDAGLHGVEMLVEYQLPLNNKRVDVILAGTHPRGGDSFVVVELKQWSSARSYEGSDRLVEVDYVSHPRLHPGLQVEGYCDYLVDFLGSLHDVGDRVRGVAYLHNATDQDVHDLFALAVNERRRVFTGQRRGQLIHHLKTHLLPGSGADAADRLLSSAVRPSRLLLQHAADELQRRHSFTLLEEQRVAYELVLHAVERARASDRKKVVIVSGGPGSGKSVIALSLLGELYRHGRSALHATGSQAFTQTMRRYAAAGSSRVKELFKYFNNFTKAERNGFDVLVCDEAHRIRETSTNRWTKRSERTNRPQLDELVAAARVPVFLLDEHQTVRPGELGSIEVISRYAKSLGLDVECVSLHGQFRCGGSVEYEQWVVRLLGLAAGGPLLWTGDGRFDVQIADSPQAMEAVLAFHQEHGLTARMSAGYCWPWSDPRQDGSLVPDVQIDGWARPWNVKSDRSVGGAPGSALWATDPAGFGQVGCVYTAQGFEYEYSGVIIGPDLVVQDGRLVSRRDYSKDPAFRSRKTIDDGEVDPLIRNTYKVLLTRGMRGTVIYATDDGTRAFLRALVDQRVPPQTNWSETPTANHR